MVINSSEMSFKTEAVILEKAPEKTLCVSDNLKIQPYSTHSSNGGSSVSKKAINMVIIHLHLKHTVRLLKTKHQPCVMSHKFTVFQHYQSITFNALSLQHFNSIQSEHFSQ
jgi:hypothetical protein